MSISHCYCSDYMTKPTQFGDEPKKNGRTRTPVISKFKHTFFVKLNRRMPNGTYCGVRGTETKVGQKTFVSRPTRFRVCELLYVCSAVYETSSYGAMKGARGEIPYIDSIIDLVYRADRT